MINGVSAQIHLTVDLVGPQTHPGIISQNATLAESPTLAQMRTKFSNEFYSKPLFS